VFEKETAKVHIFHRAMPLTHLARKRGVIFTAFPVFGGGGLPGSRRGDRLPPREIRHTDERWGGIVCSDSQ